jgi:hypothetical protein
MLIVRHQDQTGNGTENGIEIVIVREKGIGKLLKRGLQAETSVSLETGGRDIPLRPMKGTGWYYVMLGVLIQMLIVVASWI